jgi:hypothetical protein
MKRLAALVASLALVAVVSAQDHPASWNRLTADQQATLSVRQDLFRGTVSRNQRQTPTAWPPAAGPSRPQ